MRVIATNIPENMAAINLISVRIRPNMSLIIDTELVEFNAAFFAMQTKQGP